jgi:hypothetical protein
MNLATETQFTDMGGGTAREPLTPAELAPHFPQLEIIECLGRGGMGVVYKARQKTLNRVVALKLLAPERVTDAGFAERFTREAQALARLNHPNIVTIHDFGVTSAGGLQPPSATSPTPPSGDSKSPAPPQPPFYFLLMEFVDGVNLRQAMRAGRFTPEQALVIVPPVCEALHYAHEQGIVHRDIKPENLLLDKAGRVKIADFGIAKLVARHSDVETPPPDSTLESRATTGGTPGYMAPEQKSAPQLVDSRADIYSLGVVLYEMLTGELPGKELQPPSKRVQVDVRIDEIVLRALEVKPELRFATAAEFLTEVEAATREVSTGRADAGHPLFLRSGGSLRLGWPGVLELCGTLGMAVLGLNLVIALGMWLVTRQPWPMFKPQELPWVLALMAVCLVMRLAARKMKASPAAAEFRDQMEPLAGAPTAGTTWRSPTSGWGHFIGYLFGITFTSPLAFKLANLSALGFLCFLGFAPFPGAKRLFGFSGFFGLIGVAFMVELAKRWQAGDATGTPAQSASAGTSDWLAPAISLVLFFAGLVVGIPFINALPVHKDSGYLALAAFMFCLASVVGFLAANSVQQLRSSPAASANASARAWLKGLGWLAFVLAVPVIGFGIFFLLQVLTEPVTTAGGGGWNPTPSEALFVPLTWFGSVLLPIAGLTLLRLATSVPKPVTAAAKSPWRTGFAVLLAVAAAFALALLVGFLVILASYSRVREAQNVAKSARAAEQRAHDALGSQARSVVAPQTNATSTNATAMDFRVLKVESLPGLRDIRVHFQCTAPAGFGFEVCQDVTRGPYGEVPKSKDAFWLRTKWVGLNDPPVLVWTLPEDFTAAEVQAGAKQVEAHLRTMRDALRMLPTEAVSSFGKVRHREGWLYELVLRVKLARDHSPVQAADAWIVEGTVRDGEGKPVADADIHVSSGAGSLFVTGKGKTGADGAYRVGFGPGISMSAGDRRGAMQAAIVHVGKAGFTEKELGTGGDLQMAWELTPQQLAGGWQPGPHKTFLPGKPLRVDFVLLPAATVRGTLLTPDGKPVPNRTIVLVGDRLRPASSIYASAKTDADGRFTFKDVSTQHAWSFSIEKTPHHRKRTAPDRFAEARVHEITLIADGDDLRRGDAQVKPKDGAGANLPAAPHVATGEGKYELSSGATLVITAKPPPRGTGGKHFDGRLDWPKSATNPKAESFDVALSEGAPFAVGWRADGKVLWVACGAGTGTTNDMRYVRKLTIAGPGDVDEQSWDAREKHDFGGLPAELRRVFDAFIAPQATTNQETGLEDELIRLAQQRLQRVRLRSDAGRAGLLDVIEAEGALVVAESRSDALKQAEARLMTASKVLEVVDKLRLAGRADAETVLQAKQRKLAAELEVQRLRAGSLATPAKR